MIKFTLNQTFQLVSLALIISVITLIIPNTSLRSAVTRVSGIILLVFIVRFISPMLRFISQTDFLPSFETESPLPEGADEEAIIKATASELCSKLKALVSSRFEIPESQIRVTISLDTSDSEAIRVLSSTVFIKGIADQHLAFEISNYVSDLIAAKCTVILE